MRHLFFPEAEDEGVRGGRVNEGGAGVSRWVEEGEGDGGMGWDGVKG